MKIRETYIVLLFLFTANGLFAQVLVNYGGNIHINEGSVLVVAGTYHNLTDGSIDNSGDINVLGDWVNDADSGNLLKNTTGTVRFAGEGMQYISGAATTWFHKLVLQNDVTLETKTKVTAELLLDNAFLNLSAYDLVLVDDAGIADFSAMSYIVADSTGSLMRTVKNEDIVFPVGTVFSYSPIVLNNAGEEDVFGVSVFNDVLSGGSSGGTLPQITHCVNNTWRLTEQVTGGADLKITVFWDETMEGADFNRDFCGLGQYTSSGWKAQTSRSAGGNDLFSVTRPGITEPTLFAVGDTASPMAFWLNLTLDINVFLQGAFNGSNMSTGLNPDNIPTTQPYNVPPWNYQGTEVVDTIPPDVVDWVLVELRDAPQASLATSETVIDRKAAFLKNDGRITDANGNAYLSFNDSVVFSLFVVVLHRNHLAVMSAVPLTSTAGIYTYDFRMPEGQAYGTDAQKNLGDGIFGMFAGDADADGMIDAADRLMWVTEAGIQGYAPADLNLDGQVNNPDKNNIWVPNNGTNCQVPE